jgi:hypothetical protein
MRALRDDRVFAALVVLAWLPVAVFATVHHEMWRDELHCWLVARDSPWPWDVVHNRRYDGQPPLWYLLLWVLEKTTHRPVVMRVVHVGLAGACVFLFASKAPFERWLRAAFPFGYFLAYEYVAISRCYGLALLLALLVCVNHPRRTERPWTVGVLLALLALTTTVATCVVAAYTLAIFVDWIVGAGVGGASRAQGSAKSSLEDSTTRQPWTKAWIPIGCAMLACLAAALCAWPPADSTVTHIQWPKELPSDDGPTRVIAGLLPIPRPDFFFWNSNLLLSWEPFRRIAIVPSALLAGWVIFVLARDRVAAMLFGVGLALLVALFALVYGGDVRHHGFIFVLLLMGAWIARLARTPEGIGRDKAIAGTPEGIGRIGRLRDSALVPTLALILLAQIPGAAIAIGFDAKYIFSSGTRAAEALEEHGLARSLLVAEFDYPAIAALGQLGDAVAYSPRTGKPFSYVKWTASRHWDPTDEQTIAYATSLGASRGEDVTLLMNRPLRPELVDGARITRIAELYDSMIEEENFYIYRVASAGTLTAR